ncbi:MAG: hypothetical protein WBF89_01470 [Steroidobacteraceae bacterium]|jgi:hypothetical protein
MRLAVLTLSMLCLGVLVLLGLLHLLRELLIKDFFQPPSMPGDTAQADQRGAPQPASHRANPAA